MSGKERGMLWLLAAINFTHILDFMIMMPLGNYLMPYFHITAQQFSFIVASYTISAGISGFTAAFFVDNYDRKKVLLFAYIGFVIGTFLCGLAPTYHMLVGARILAGIFGGLIGAQVLSIVADSFSYERRGKAMGTLMSAFSLASVIGVPLGLFLATRISWHAPFLLVGGMGLIIIPLVYKYLPSISGHLTNKESRVKPLKVLTTIFKNPAQRLALSFSALMMMGHFLIIPFLNPYMEFNVGFTKDQTMLIYTVGGMATFFTAPYIGKLADKYGKRKVFTIFVLCSLVPIFLITNMPAIPFYYVLIVTGIWFILSLGRNIPAQAMISNVVEPVQRGSFMSFNSSVQQMFTGIASLIAGVIVIKQPSGAIEHYRWVGYLSMVLVCCSIFIARGIEGKSKLKA